MADCVFCKIIEGKIPAGKIAESEHALAFADINPAAPVHVLVVPAAASVNVVVGRSVMPGRPTSGGGFLTPAA